MLNQFGVSEHLRLVGHAPYIYVYGRFPNILPQRRGPGIVRAFRQGDVHDAFESMASVDLPPATLANLWRLVNRRSSRFFLLEHAARSARVSMLTSYGSRWVNQ